MQTLRIVPPQSKRPAETAASRREPSPTTRPATDRPGTVDANVKTEVELEPFWYAIIDRATD
jgi:hypothetical protein